MSDTGRVIAMGFFDGVHLGHAALLDRVRLRSAEHGLSPAVLSFDVHPDNLVFGQKVSLINRTADKKKIIKSLFGIDDVILLRFTRDLMQMNWENFLDLLVGEFNVRWVVVGHDFTFGYRGEGKTQQLQSYCAEHGIGCDIIPPVYMDGGIVSSTAIRSLIEKGEIAEANRLLGHDFFISGTVIHGLHNGRKLGFPTLNIKMPAEQVVPRFGVYAATVTTEDGKEYPAATDIGVKPTVCSDNETLVESNLFNFSGDIYGQDVEVTLKSFIRPEKHFASFDELKESIGVDVLAIKTYFGI